MAEINNTFKQIFALDYRSLALLRVTLAFIILLDLYWRSQWLSAHYSDAGILPVHLLDLSNYSFAWYFKLLTLSGESWFVALFFILNTVFAIGLLFGYHTRFMTILCWIFLCSLHLRNGMILNSGDTLLRMILFWCMFLPLGARFSVDSILRYTSSSSFSVGKLEFSAASIALYVQAFLLYFFAGLYKIRHMSWLDGSHVYNSFSRGEYLQPLGQFLYPYYDVLTFFTYFTLFIELFGPVLFLIPFAFGPVRTLTVILFTIFQIGLLLTMYLGIFPLISIAATIAFLPAWFWDKVSEYGNHKLARLQIFIQSYSRIWKNIVLNHYPHIPVLAGRPGLPHWQNAIAGLILLYVIIWNIEGAHRNFKLPDSFKTPGYHLAVHQQWGMFGAPASYTGWIVVSALTNDGNEIDLLNNKPVSWEKPELISRQFGYARWRKYLSDNLRKEENKHHQEYYLRYLQNNWNSQNSEQDYITSLKLIHMRYTIGTFYNHSEPTAVVLYEFNGTQR